MNKTLFAHAAAAVAALSAGGGVVATRLVIGETDPVSLAFYRNFVSVICFAPVLPFIWPKHRIPLTEYGKIALLGILFFGFFPWALNASLQYIPAARGAVGLATIPIQTLIVAVLFGRENLTLAKLIAVGLAFMGVAFVFGLEAINLSTSEYLVGDSLMLLGVFCAAIYSVFGRGTLMRHGPLFVTALAMVFAALALFPLTYFQSGTVGVPVLTREGWLAVLFLGSVSGAIQFSLFTWALRWLPATTTVLYLTLSPVTAMLLGVFLIGETVTSVLVAGLIFILSGILIGSGALSGLTTKVADRSFRRPLRLRP
ncbi:MAG: DMT family transporter [Rhodospirillaceae bacterium]|jgi:drug/metabolite transporter (DMT)-like permease|nr:DMT family transporter [Rhodospirillaceae bacterium]MBT5898832.1 DMT family transporter [Rhodospirillaceae bacterium]MBT7664266.1 DMT family transporter [Rhodospirillaceae bacterium]MBT7759057.1 DMT family transporter [Rhodospirillaceae bacterium]